MTKDEFKELFLRRKVKTKPWHLRDSRGLYLTMEQSYLVG